MRAVIEVTGTRQKLANKARSDPGAAIAAVALRRYLASLCQSSAAAIALFVGSSPPRRLNARCQIISPIHPQDQDVIRWRLTGAEVFFEKRRADPTTSALKSRDEDGGGGEGAAEGDRWDGFSKGPRLDAVRVERGVWEGDTGALFTISKKIKISPWRVGANQLRSPLANRSARITAGVACPAFWLVTCAPPRRRWAAEPRLQWALATRHKMTGAHGKQRAWVLLKASSREYCWRSRSLPAPPLSTTLRRRPAPPAERHVDLRRAGDRATRHY